MAGRKFCFEYRVLWFVELLVKLVFALLRAGTVSVIASLLFSNPGNRCDMSVVLLQVAMFSNPAHRPSLVSSATSLDLLDSFT